MRRDPSASIERRSGVALWRQIADEIRRLAGGGEFGPRLPSEPALAERFGVNRHTVRSAIAALVREGVLRAEQGRGTFVEKRRRYSYPIGLRTRFSAGLEGQAHERRGVLARHAVEPAAPDIAKALELEAGCPVLRLETISEADGRPLSRATSWFDARRFAGLEKAYEQCSSITEAFRAFGVADYFRRSTVISARHADSSDLAALQLAPGAIVLLATAINVDGDGRPIQFAQTRFAADRVELTVLGTQ